MITVIREHFPEIVRAGRDYFVYNAFNVVFLMFITILIIANEHPDKELASGCDALSFIPLNYSIFFRLKSGFQRKDGPPSRSVENCFSSDRQSIAVYFRQEDRGAQDSYPGIFYSLFHNLWLFKTESQCAYGLHRFKTIDCVLYILFRSSDGSTSLNRSRLVVPSLPIFRSMLLNGPG